jgi:5-enolpyruvylshikimate-3-phosphate synthase
MAMAALNSIDGIQIQGAGSVDVSFPGFFSALGKVAVS